MLFLPTILLSTSIGQVAPKYTLRQYMAIKRSDACNFSPDASMISFLSTSSGKWQLWITSARGGKPKKLTSFAENVSGASWSPKGGSILVVADGGGDQRNQFYLVDSESGTRTLITSDKKADHEFGCWSSDGKSIFYTLNGRDERFFDCCRMDVESHQAKIVYQASKVLRSLVASSDGHYIAAEDVKSEVDSDILLIDTEKKSARILTEHKGKSVFSPVGFSTDSKSLYFRSNQGREFIAVMASDLSGGGTRTVAAPHHDIDAAVLSSNGQLLAVTENIAGFESLSIWDPVRATKLVTPTIPQGIVFPAGFSTDGSLFAFTLNRPVHDDEVWTTECRTGRSRQVTQTSQAGIDSRDLILPKAISYRSFDGRSIPALLYVPRGASPAHRAPVVVSVHGGPEDQEKPYITGEYQMLLANGYAVLAPNIRGSTGYGKSYVDLDNGRLRWNALKDLAYAVRWIHGQPNLNGNKVACFGASYGGFATLAMLAHYSHLFKAGIDFYGPSDLKTFLSRTAPYRRPNRIAEYGDPSKDPKFFEAISPARHARHIKVPLLVIQGANDPIVPPAESEDVVRLVRSAGGKAEFLLLQGEGHGFAKEDSRIRAFNRMLAFLKRYCPCR